MTEVTIIIPNYNGKKLLENCIKTLERQTCQEFKLLVIDIGEPLHGNGRTAGKYRILWCGKPWL